VRNMNSDPNCIFCKIISGAIPCHKILETEKTLAFLDINPLSEGHALVIPKYHCVKLHELPPEQMADTGPVLVKVAKAVGATDYNILQNNGTAAHQAVKHVHFHIIPRIGEEGLGISWEQKDTDHPKFKTLADQIKGRL